MVRVIIVGVILTFRSLTQEALEVVSLLFFERAVGRFTNGFSGPKSFRDFREKGPRSLEPFGKTKEAT